MLTCVAPVLKCASIRARILCTSELSTNMQIAPFRSRARLASPDAILRITPEPLAGSLKIDASALPGAWHRRYKDLRMAKQRLPQSDKLRARESSGRRARRTLGGQHGKGVGWRNGSGFDPI